VDGRNPRSVALQWRIAPGAAITLIGGKNKITDSFGCFAVN
jgi:hypothetical protein